MRNTIDERYIMLWCLNRPPDVFSLNFAAEMIEQVIVRALENVQNSL